MLFADLCGVFRRHEKTSRKSRGVDDLKNWKAVLCSNKLTCPSFNAERIIKAPAIIQINPRSLHFQFLKQSDVTPYTMQSERMNQMKTAAPTKLSPWHSTMTSWNILLAARTQYYNCHIRRQNYRYVIKMYQKLGSQACCQKKTQPDHKAKTDETDWLSRYIAMLAYSLPK